MHYLFGLAKNSRLFRHIEKPLRKSARRCRSSGRPSRRYVQFRYRTRHTWSCTRQVLAKVEWLAKGTNPRFVVINLPKRYGGGIRQLYEQQYCAQGNMENRIKEQQQCLIPDRPSCSWMRVNQLRLYFSSFAYVLMQARPRVGLKGTPLAGAQCSTIRQKLLKLATRVNLTTRGVWLSLWQHYPWQSDFAWCWRISHRCGCARLR